LFDDPYLGLEEGSRAVRKPAHVALAREAAVKGLVLLKNEGVLPLARGGRLAVIGPLADDRIDMQGTWAIDVDPAHNVTVMEGLRAAGGNTHVLHARGCNIVEDANVAARLNIHNRDMPSVVIDARPLAEMLDEARAIAEQADAIVLCLGEAKEHAGESATRLDIALPGAQQALFDCMRATGKPLVVVAISGRPLALTGVMEADALIWTGHPGSEGGHAIAEVLFGDKAPSGRLSMALPRHVGQLPLATEELPSGRPKDAIGIDVPGDHEVDEAGRHVFRKFTTACIIEGPATPLFPAGFGLTYTRFAYGAATASAGKLKGADAVLEVSVPVTNAGAREGTEVVQLWLRDPVAMISRPVRELRGFVRLTLRPGDRAVARFRLTADDLCYDRGTSLAEMVRGWEAGDFILMVGPNARDVQALTVTWER
jgi:beta-glucosidase